MTRKVDIFDSTLRDGAQAEGISFSVEDKLKIVRTLDDLGVAYIEAGNPGSNPKDIEFFERMRHVKLKNARLAAFGSTRRRDITVEEDSNVQSLLSAGTPVIVIFGKSWDFHVKEVIRTTLEENLNMIRETVAFFKKKKKEVIFDAEHFYDGYKANPDYALKALNAAVEGGADCIVLCDTNGGSFPSEIYEITRKVAESFKVKIGIHTHNDAGMAVANTIMAVEAERPMSRNIPGFRRTLRKRQLSTIIPNLQQGDNLHTPGQAGDADPCGKEDLGDLEYDYEREGSLCGNSAFAHKGGCISTALPRRQILEHVDPDLVGNKRRFLMSEVAGRRTILDKMREICPSITKESREAEAVINRLKELEHNGYQFEGAESSFELIIRKQLGKYQPFFELESFKLITEQPSKPGPSASALIKVKVEGRSEITAAEGDGPVHALDRALRKALEVFYPELSSVHLTDFKVRVIDSESATAAKVRVLIESTDGESVWSTVGVSTDIIEASWTALVDSIEYKLIKDLEKKIRVYM